MPIVRFTGQVYPARTNFNSAKTIKISWGTSDLGFPLIITMIIVNGIAHADCEVETFQEGNIPILLHRSYQLIEAYLDLASFGTGIGFRVELDRIFRPGDEAGSEVFVMDEVLSGLCQSFKFPPKTSIENMELDKLLTIVLGDPVLMGGLRDLSEVLAKFNTTPTNCARVIDSLRKSISPGEKDKKKGWKNLQEAINCDENYLNWVSANSTETRHGDYWTPIYGTTVKEIRIRTWIAMNRFIEYRKNGNVKLDKIRFPLLIHDPAFPFPTPQS